jgi:solute carrier family 25 protein 44
MQGVSGGLYAGTLDAFRQIVRSEGPRGLYKGFGANAIGIATGNLYITVYELTRRLALSHDLDSRYINFVAGASASLLSQTVVVPSDVISQHLMMNAQTRRSHGILNVSRKIWRSSGLRGFYRGYLPSIATYAPSSALWWGTYGELSPRLWRVCDRLHLSDAWKLGLSQAGAGGCAGLVAGM